MELCRYSLSEIIEKDIRVIGVIGCPPAAELEAAQRRFPLAPFFQLERVFGTATESILPVASCSPIRQCVDNALAASHQLLCVVVATGEDKCDAARYTAHVLSSYLDVPVVRTSNRLGGTPQQPLLCEAKGSLLQRAVRIHESIIDPLSEPERSNAFISRCEPTVGFWGTLPFPLQILNLFPHSTHLFGWLRCVEQNTPADMALESTINEDIPTVFFVQKHCAKAILAVELARRTGGLVVEVHDSLDDHTIEKINTFIHS